MDSKHQSISHTMSAKMMEAINTITELCANSLRVGQLTLWTNSLYDSFTFSTKAISVDFLIISLSATKAGSSKCQSRIGSYFFLTFWGEGVTLRFARKAGIEPTLTVLETAFLPLEDFRKMPRPGLAFSENLGFGELRK